jgi:hypothetical protein
MTVEKQDKPSDYEVRTELERMLSSTDFKTSGKQKSLLQYVVEQALAKEQITQADILVELYGVHVDPFSNNAKATATLVRTKIEQYYKNEGKDDLVRIELPPGPGYRPDFSYNFQATVIREYRKALSYRRKITRKDLIISDGLLIHCMARDSTYAPIHAALAENFLLRQLLDNIFDTGKTPDTWGSGMLVERVLKSDPESWLAHIVLGVLMLFKFDWDRAKSAFDMALKLDPHKTMANLWYAAF